MIPPPAAPFISADAVLASAKSITRSILSLAASRILAQTSVSGWTIAQPTTEQLSEIRKVLIATSQPGAVNNPKDVFAFPEDFDTNVVITRGSLDIISPEGHVITSIGAQGNTFHFAPRGSGRSMRATAHPTQVCCVMWKEVEPDGSEANLV